MTTRAAMIEAVRRAAAYWTEPFNYAHGGKAEAAALTAAAEALEAGAWRLMSEAPKGQEIEVEMPRYQGNVEVGTWVATAILPDHEEIGHWTEGAVILHYNGDALVPGFRGPLRRWRPLPAPPDAGE